MRGCKASVPVTDCGGAQAESILIQVANLNDRFTFADDHFDLVNSRFVAGGISYSRWPSYIADIKRQVSLLRGI